MNDVDYGVELQGIYDGIAFWVMKDGTRVNRWSGIEGYERRAELIDEAMRKWKA